ncbi:helix-turn-helix domain-containing protein [Micrococcus sp. EYE_162]|uniref:IclR family transcriptional regulator n=1 Tax=Micrococcus TaxID=1269 RepID=UPI0020044DDC|nr:MULTISPECIES: helix-turn-helix domain-containing protein [unclassified Micrococcus]MCK6095403.1 helix-turn-helix domain-containing protein [Micrococcus sp. EYE_212]MCK6171478.1 helix-turn-helix domain-containing protein [Micrococcus sp. EYE_162]
MATASTRTVDRALELLAAVTEEAPLSLSEAARTADLPPSTALRLLRSLESAGLVARDDDAQYRPGPRLLQIGARAFTREPLVALSRDAMEEVVAGTGESVYLAIHGPGETALYIAIVEGTHSVRHTNWVGRTVPLAESAVGRAFRGEVPAGEYTQRTHSVEPDVTALTSPVVVRGAVVGALSTLVPDYRCTDELAERCGRALVAATARIARALSGD